VEELEGIARRGPRCDPRGAVLLRDPVTILRCDRSLEVLETPRAELLDASRDRLLELIHHGSSISFCRTLTYIYLPVFDGYVQIFRRDRPNRVVAILYGAVMAIRAL
jgi:hypothetical protein